MTVKLEAPAAGAIIVVAAVMGLAAAEWTSQG
jgi:hypothetical protein